jgi:hypothetical protein
MRSNEKKGAQLLGVVAHVGQYECCPPSAALGRVGGKKRIKFHRITAKTAAINSDKLLTDNEHIYAVWYPVAGIKTDESRFQNRDNKFSETSVSRIVANYDPNKLDPVTLWRDADGKTWMLSGHSRLEAFKRLGLQKIPARFFVGSQAAAITFARVDANRLTDAEKLLEDIRAFMLERDGNDKHNIKPLDKKDLRQRWQKYNKLEAYTYLNPKGKFLEVLASDAKKSFPYIENKATHVGYMRKKWTVLTNLHENEIFEYLYGEKKRALEMDKETLEDKVKSVVEREDWKNSTPLYLDRAGTRGADARADTRESRLAIKEKQREIVDFKKRIKIAFTDVEKEALRVMIARTEKEVERLSAGVETSLKTQNALFGKDSAEKWAGVFTAGECNSKTNPIRYTLIAQDGRVIAERVTFAKLNTLYDKYY